MKKFDVVITYDAVVVYSRTVRVQASSEKAAAALALCMVDQNHTQFAARTTYTTAPEISEVLST